MTYTRRQTVRCLSILYLVATIGLAGYALSRGNKYSVPISKTLAKFTTALPVIAGLLLEGGYGVTRARRNRFNQGQTQRPPLVILVNTIIFIYSTAVITLLGTHTAPPSGLDCGLRNRWQTLFQQKDENAIKRIQNAFNCCGFKNPRDMPWPFPEKGKGIGVCQDAFSRDKGCFGSWKAEEQQVAGILMGVVAMVVIWQFAFIVIPTERESWLHSIVPDRISRMIADEGHGGNDEARRAIEYTGYSDRIEEEDHEDNPILGRAIEEGNGRLDNTLPGHGDQDPQGIVENAWARA